MSKVTVVRDSATQLLTHVSFSRKKPGSLCVFLVFPIRRSTPTTSAGLVQFRHLRNTIDSPARFFVLGIRTDAAREGRFLICFTGSSGRSKRCVRSGL